MRVGVRERREHRPRDMQRARYRQRVTAERRVQRGPVEELHRDELDAVLVLPVVVDPDAPRMIEPCDRVRLALEPGFEVVGQASDHLERDVLAQAGVLRAIDGPHASLPEQREDPVATGEDRARGESHRRS